MQGTEISGDLADLLRQYRLAAGLTQEALAERADVGLRSIQGIERGERLPRHETLQRLITALALSAEQNRRLDAMVRRRDRPRTSTSSRQNGRDRVATKIKRDGLSRLPVPLTSFIGRERELSEVQSLLRAHRLVTLTGPPGVGKTRLVLEVAPRLAADFPNGVFVVPLAAVRDSSLVLPILAQAVGIAGYESQPLVERLVETLRSRRLLFVLDNFEHVEAAAPRVAQLLEGCPHLAVLATSRTRLRIRGEHEFVVPPLAVPTSAVLSDRSHDPGTIASESEAVRLFVDRARHVQAALGLDRVNVLAIAEICRQLDGLPLAIELAAARCKVLPPPVLLKRLSDRFVALGAGPVDLPPRQQTLRAAIAWSYDLLGDTERALFRRLAVFVGGFSLEVVEAVCGGTLDDLAVLVDQSLVQEDVPLATAKAEEPRFRMLETVRDFAREHLAASGEEDSLLAKHAAHFLTFVERAQLGTARPGVEYWDRLTSEQGNLRAALRFLIDRGDVEMVARMAPLLRYFWALGSGAYEARQWLGEMLERTGDSDRTEARARILMTFALLAWKQSDNASASRRLDESLGILRELGDRPDIADGLTLSGLIARWRGRYEEAIRLFEDAIAIWRELNNPGGIAGLHDLLGLTTFWHGDRARGRALLEQSVAQWRMLGVRVLEGWALYNLGLVAHGLEDYTFANSCYEQSLAIDREFGAGRNVAEVLGGLGDLALDRGDLDGARVCLAEALQVHWDIGNRREVARMLECFAGLAALESHPERAIRLWASAVKLREIIGEPVPPDQKVRLERRVENIPQVVSEAVFARAWAAGQAMSLADAVAEALR